MIKKSEPLTESYFYILLCLYSGPNHGYGIMQDTLRLSNERVKIGSGTMYGATSNMIKKGWIVEDKESNEALDRKRLYKLTNIGKEVLDREIERLKELLISVENIKAEK